MFFFFLLLFFFSFFALYLSYEWLVGTIFSQLVFPQKTGTKTVIFSKPHFLQKNSGFRPFQTLFVATNAFWGFSKFAISEQLFLIFKIDTLQKPLFL